MKRFKDLGMITAVLVLILGLTAVVSVFAENKSPMFSRQVPGGLFAVINDTQTTGNIWFVDSGSSNASDAAGYGQNPDAPFATIDYAIGNCTASNGDWIMVMPGHAESISTEGQITADVAGIRIIGLGVGRTRPVLTWTAAAGAILVSAANVSIENMILDMSRSGGAHTGVSITATDAKIKALEIIPSDDAGGKVGHAIYLAGATRTWITDTDFLGSLAATSAVTGIVRVGPRDDDVKIENCQFRAYVASTSNGMIEGGSNSVSGFVLADSSFVNGNAGSSPWYWSSTTIADGTVANVTSRGHTNSGDTLFQVVPIKWMKTMGY